EGWGDGGVVDEVVGEVEVVRVDAAEDDVGVGQLAALRLVALDLHDAGAGTGGLQDVGPVLVREARHDEVGNEQDLHGYLTEVVRSPLPTGERASVRGAPRSRGEVVEAERAAGSDIAAALLRGSAANN